MAQPRNREVRYEYYTSRDWVQALGRGRKHLLVPDRQPPQEGSWWQHLTALWREKPGFRVGIPLSKYRLEQNNQRIIICVQAIPDDSWQQIYQSSRDEVLKTTIKSTKSVKSFNWLNNSVVLYAVMFVFVITVGYVRFELLG